MAAGIIPEIARRFRRERNARFRVASAQQALGGSKYFMVHFIILIIRGRQCQFHLLRKQSHSKHRDSNGDLRMNWQKL
jgi:hypothetical protein